MDLKEKPNIVGGDNISEKEFLKLDDLGDGNYLTTSYETAMERKTLSKQKITLS